MARNRFRNLFDAYQHDTEECIFISHQKGDSQIARKIADYILKAGIDVYFDEYDLSIVQGDPYSVVKSIKSGINNSTRMLCLLTSNAMKSKWMPWEIGYGYDKTSVFGLTDKEYSEYSLPEYLQVVPIIRGTKSLNEKLSELLHLSKERLVFENRLVNFDRASHPLDDVLNWNK